MTWSTQPTATRWGGVAAPVANQWWGVDITAAYNPWVSNPSANYGLRIDPLSTNNNFDRFRSSRYSSDGYRPILQLNFTPPVTVPNFKMPLPGNLSWLVTNEVGGWECKRNWEYDAAHDGTNYFSIDYSWRTRETKYSSTSNIPIIAAAGGKVVEATWSDNNGYYVVIDHDGDGNLSTGFSTRYLHFKSQPAVWAGKTVAQGDLLGYMGDTGKSDGVHLHFGVRYDNSGAATSNGRYTVVDGRILKSFQTECANGDWIRFYKSTNRTY